MDVPLILTTLLKIAILWVIFIVLYNIFYRHFWRWEYDLNLGFEFPLVFSVLLAYVITLVIMELLYYAPYGAYFGGVIGIPKEASDPLFESILGLLLYNGVMIICAILIYLLVTYFIKMQRRNLLGRLFLLILIVLISMPFVNAGFSAKQIDIPGEVGYAVFYETITGSQSTSDEKSQEKTLLREVKIALLPFENIEQPKDDILKTMITNGIIDKLESTKNITLIDSYKVEDTLREIESEGIVSKEEIPMELGKRVSADAVIVGEYKQKGDRLEITAILILIEENGKKEVVEVKGDKTDREKLCEEVTRGVVGKL